MRNNVILFICALLVYSCKQDPSTADDVKEFEFVVVDSLVTDLLETVRVLDYHHEKGLYLAVKYMTMEGHYYILDKSGNVVAENFLSEGPDAFGLVLVRAGFVGDEILFVSEGTSYVYDLSLKQKRRFPFEQGVRMRLIHWTRDNLSTFRMNDGSLHALMNLNDAYLQTYPMDYYDTLQLAHLMDIQTGAIHKGGKLLPNTKFTSGKFYPFMDKPLFFSDQFSSTISTILYGDTLLYQLDPVKNFELVQAISLPRITPDQIKEVSMDQASYATVREFRSDNVTLGGMFDQLLGYGDELLVGYRSGGRPDLVFDNPSPEQSEAFSASQKRYYFLIKDGKRMGQAIPWDKPGSLILNVGPNRYLHYADQADLHETENDYQSYPIYELREKVQK
ncbi:hypothetical protein [Mongoliitalea lutea]|uniref:6-bladed beta-propeller protein n=1 Tax=Mongoliitalea lutea TaxID=849756 RepID=A0A8J3G644_9BACT|nr:hypothetical protein [Mongoliitalea lutea]GHB40894.1 hypothetical protein GCM10008106_22520 [Mongoliitalea lutea]